MSDTDSPASIDPTASLLEEQFIRQLMGPSLHNNACTGLPFEDSEESTEGLALKDIMAQPVRPLTDKEEQRLDELTAIFDGKADSPIILGDPGCTASPEQVKDFMEHFAERFADQLTPTPDEWAMIQRENAALTAQVKADEDEALRAKIERLSAENEALRAEAMQVNEEDDDDQCLPLGRAATNDDKEEVLGRLLEIWAKHPELRLGQLILNAIPPTTLYHMEDYSLVGRLALHYNGKSGESKDSND